MRICIFEDERAANLEPLSLTRPVFDLLCGQKSLATKQLQFFGAAEFSVLIRPYLVDTYCQTRPGVRVNEIPQQSAESTVLVNGRWLPPADRCSDSSPHVALIGDEVAYAIVGADQWTDCLPGTMSECTNNWRQTLPERQAPGIMIDYPWQLVENNLSQLRVDFDGEIGEGHLNLSEGVALFGPQDQVRIAPTARIEPMVLLDASNGPITVDQEAVVTAFSRIEGPCYVGRQSHVMGARIRGGATIGAQCRIGGEVEASIIHGFSNKYHEGFLGHAYVGEWVNLGAGTHNSDLRNDYGPVRVPMQQGSVDTGLTKVGCFIGDHVRTGLGTLINTGANIGMFSNLLPAGLLAPKYIPPFSMWWKGTLQETRNLSALLETAEAAMQRRGCQLTEDHKTLYRYLFDETFFLRQKALHEADRRRISKSI